MSDSSAAAPDDVSPGALRQKLEEALQANRQLADSNRSLTIEKVIRDGASYVKPEELATVPLGEVATTAARLQAERVALREQLRTELVTELGVPATSSPDNQAQARVASLGSLGGTPPPATAPREPRNARERIRQGL